MSQLTIAGGFIHVSDSAQAKGNFYTTLPAQNFSVDLSLNANDTGKIVVYLSFDSINSGTRYEVTSVAQTIPVPDKATLVEGILEGGSGDVSGLFFQIMQTAQS